MEYKIYLCLTNCDSLQFILQKYENWLNKNNINKNNNKIVKIVFLSFYLESRSCNGSNAPKFVKIGFNMYKIWRFKEIT